MKNICVSVGVGIDGQKEIMSALSKEGYAVDCSYEKWLRDNWVKFRDKYFFRGDVGITDNFIWVPGKKKVYLIDIYGWKFMGGKDFKKFKDFF